jgi:hypothetical protein
MLQLISTTIDKMIWQDKSTRGVILFDEVAEQLKWDGMLRRIQWFYQAIRKQNGSIGIVLQSIAQLPKNNWPPAWLIGEFWFLSPPRMGTNYPDPNITFA